MITISINDKKAEIKENTSLEQFLQSQLINTQGVAVAVNGSVVPKQKWSKILNDGDKILVITATQGG